MYTEQKKGQTSYREIPKLSDVNLGGMGLRGERTPFIKNVACSPDEITSIKNLRAKGVHVYYQLVPEQQVIEVDGYLNE